MAHFANADPQLSCRYKNKATHGGNHAPSVADWFKNDDTLDRQGVSQGKPNGHGICKGTASSWVIAFLNGVRDSYTANTYEEFYTNFLRYQATMVKDFGKHIDSHVAQFKKLGVETNIKEYKSIKVVNLTKSDIPDGRWGAYISCWHHDIACGGTWGTTGNSYICQPNTGLLGYTNYLTMLSDLGTYLDSRRSSKSKPATEPAGFWIYRPG
ncbi:hypothetical protein [Novosphingobium sp.]|uniref:hypothetical protein n=1 Tax=Novosphingobium sp. TaxID=1874826 RepID=UPI0025F93A6E|nr:hypothetical protein [Novosphingobium sp.]